MNPYPLHFSLHSCRPFLPTLHVGIIFSSLNSKFGSQPVHFENFWNQVEIWSKNPVHGLHKDWNIRNEKSGPNNLDRGPNSGPMKLIKNLPFSRHRTQYFYFSHIELVFFQLDAIPLYKINYSSLCYIWSFQHLLVKEIISLDCISNNQGYPDSFRVRNLDSEHRYASIMDGPCKIGQPNLW